MDGQREVKFVSREVEVRGEMMYSGAASSTGSEKGEGVRKDLCLVWDFFWGGVWGKEGKGGYILLFRIMCLRIAVRGQRKPWTR